MLKPTQYSDAGVDINKANATINELGPAITATFSKDVLSPLGGFAALYDLKSVLHDYEEPVLVQSVDGIGTKTMIAGLMNRYRGLGSDLVSATSNDILVCGAKPLTLLDYVATDRLQPHAIKELILGIGEACQHYGISLVGGETAEMPGVFKAHELDVVGMITGVVEKKKIISGKDIVPGDNVFAFASSGLHTNGYSLARYLLLQQKQWSLDKIIDGLEKPLGELLLEPHSNYSKPVHLLLEHQLPIKGMAHITGGGLFDNVPRILPHHCAVEINKGTWPIPSLFFILQDLGKMNELELYRTFNMGIGYILIGDSSILSIANQLLELSYPQYKLHCIGQVVEGTKEVRLCA